MQQKIGISTSTDALSSGDVAGLLERGALHITMAFNTVPEVIYMHNRPAEGTLDLEAGPPGEQRGEAGRPTWSCAMIQWQTYHCIIVTCNKGLYTEISCEQLKCEQKVMGTEG